MSGWSGMLVTVGRGVPIGGVVAASDVPGRHAHPEMNPGAPSRAKSSQPVLDGSAGVAMPRCVHVVAVIRDVVSRSVAR